MENLCYSYDEHDELTLPQSKADTHDSHNTTLCFPLAMTWYHWCPCCYHLCQIVLIMLGHYSSYANVTVHNQVKSKVAIIMQWASHGCDSYECCVIIMSTCCDEWWQSDHLSSSPQVWRSPVWCGWKMHLLCCCWVTLSFLVKPLLASSLL